MQNLTGKLFSVLLFLLGLTIVVSWFFHLLPLLQMHLNSIPAVFNDGLCFILMGMALFLCRQKRFLQYGVQWISGLLFILAGLSVGQDVLNVNVGIDQLFVKGGDYLSPHIGRMSPIFAVAVICAAIVFQLIAFARNNGAAMSIEVLIYFIFLLSVLGLTSCLFNLDFLASYLQIAPFTVMGMVVLSIGLWNVWRSHPYSDWYVGQEDIKIILVSSAILFGIAFIAGLASFINVTQQKNDAVSKSFQQFLKNEADLFQSEIDRVFLELRAVHENPLFQQVFSEDMNQATSANMQGLLQFFLAEGFSAVTVYDQNRQQKATVGQAVTNPRLQVKLSLPHDPVLIWKNGWYLQITKEINVRNKQAGFLSVEWPLLKINQSLMGTHIFGKTAKFAICAPETPTKTVCLSYQPYPPSYHISSHISDQQLSLMDYALRGETGVNVTYDKQYHQVLAAYAPLGLLGLGLAIKMDLSEIYHPIIQGLHIIFPIILLSILLGILLLRLAVLPLVRQLIHAEQTLLITNKQLRKNEKLKDEFISIVNHELRTPLTSIRGSLGLILSGAKEMTPTKAQQLLEIANSNCERLLALINDILDMGKIEAEKMTFKFYDIHQLIVNAIEANQMYAEKFSVTLKLGETVSGIIVRVDADRFMQVISNLISNAIKFSPAGETVIIALNQRDKLIRISVSDKGPGIPDEFKARIFQKFSQADSSSIRNKGGSGLGLSISKTIVEKLGGTLQYSSQLNEGTVFYVDLPAWYEDTTEKQKSNEIEKTELVD